MTPFPNPLIHPVPPAVNIANISNTWPCVITTTVPHNYVAGIVCRIVIPYPKVMEEINGKTFTMTTVVGAPTLLLPILSVSGNTPTTFLNTRNIGAFVAAPLVRIVPPPPAVPFFAPGQQAQIIPTGDFTAGTIENPADIIGPNNPPIPLPGN